MQPIDPVRLTSLSSGLRGIDEAMGLIDFLLEADATLQDVLHLYLGTPPAFIDGLSQLGLAAWCRHTEPLHPIWIEEIGQGPGVYKRVVNTGYGVSRVRIGTYRWSAVNDSKPDPLLVQPQLLALAAMMVSQMLLDGCTTVSTEEHKGVMIRDLKRRVLALFSEVLIERPERLQVSYDVIEDHFHMNLFRLRRDRMEQAALVRALGRTEFQPRGFLYQGNGPKIEIKMRDVPDKHWVEFYQECPIADTIPPEPVSGPGLHGAILQSLEGPV